MMSKSIKIAHLSSVHQRNDTRIFIKMCTSLAKKEKYQVYLIVADGKGDDKENGVNIIDVGAKAGGRLSRIMKTVQKVFEKAKELNCDIYHIHDPELLLIALRLKKLGKKIIFDSHEDVEKDILSKEWIPRLLRNNISSFYNLYERYVCKRLDYIVAATPYIRDKFIKINNNSIDINNFPILGELVNDVSWSEKKDEVCYVGGIAKIRGIKELVKAMELIDGVKLNLAGSFSEKYTEEEVKSYDGWQKVNELGFLKRNSVADVMGYSKAGIVTFHPLPNHIDAQPNKMFEYMSSGLPIITSNFPLWREIVDGSECGICVDPLDPKEIAKAIEYIITHPKEAEQMGKNGQKAVLEKYNWSMEEKKLFNMYKELER